MCRGLLSRFLRGLVGLSGCAHHGKKSRSDEIIMAFFFFFFFSTIYYAVLNHSLWQTIHTRVQPTGIYVQDC
jgi:hypothetical protein